MTNMQAAIGLAQLERLDQFIDRKRRMGLLYTECLKDMTNIQLPLHTTDYSENIYWVYGIVLRDMSGIDAADAIDRFNAVGVGTRAFFCPMNIQPLFSKSNIFKSECFPVAEKLYKQGFYIPSGLGLNEETIIKVAERVKKVLKGFVK